MANEKWLVEPEMLKNKLYEICDEYNTERLHIDRIIDEIDDATTVDAVEVKHGRWDRYEPDNSGYRKPKCSVCGEYHLAWWSDYTHCNYCPNCGADMRDGDGNG